MSRRANIWFDSVRLFASGGVAASRNSPAITFVSCLDLDHFDEKTKKTIEREVKADFLEALPGIRKLHKRARLGVYLAYRYYYQLLLKIEKMSPEQLLAKRASVDNRHKYLLLLKSYIRFKLGLI